MALATSLIVKLATVLTGTADLSTPTDHLEQDLTQLLSTGSGANQASNIFHDRRTLGASGTEDLDLAASLVNPLGATLTFTVLKAVILKAAAANANNVNLTRPASNGVPLFLAAGDGIALRPGALFVWVSPDATGVAVTAGTGDLLTLTNSGGGTSVTYDVILIGVA